MKAVLLGMNNPLSSRPEHALFPYPPGCTGYRLLKLLQRRLPDVGRREYLAAFDRRNLLSRVVWSRDDARVAARKFATNLEEHRGRTIVTLGHEVRSLMGLPDRLIEPIVDRLSGVTWRQLPHPSGRNHWYNDETNADLAALLLEELYQEGAK